jgi:hypothetical protein
MPFDGSGTYAPPSAPNFPAIPGAVITAAYYNTVINDISSALTLCLTRDGQSSPSGAVGWANNNLTAVATFGAVTGNFSGAVTVGGTLTAIGNIGLGTSTPSLYGRFAVYPVTSAGSENHISTVAGSAGAFTSNLRLGVYSLNGALGCSISAIVNYPFSTATSLAFGTAPGGAAITDSPTERMRITSEGNVGIGTSAPNYRLAIASNDTTPGLGYALSIHANATAAAGGIQFTNSGATTQWGFLSATATSVTLDASSSSNLAFRTNSTERMRITSEGQFRWGASATIDTVSFLPFQVTGGIAIDTNTTALTTAISFFNGQGPNTRVGWIGTSGSSTSYNTSSDYRLKNIDGPLQNSGAYIDALNPVQGNWKADGSRFIGLLAHEVQEVSETPIAAGEKDGKEMQAMDYSAPELIANLIAEIQSLRARVAQLEGN